MGDVDGEIKTLKKALTVKDDSLLIHLALAERHEVHMLRGPAHTYNSAHRHTNHVESMYDLA